MARKQALGRGLKALIPDTPRARTGMTEIPVDRITPNPNQPRHTFDPDALDALAASVAEHGVLQPLLVSEDGEGRYVLIAGERRWRAARQAGLATVPAVIRERLDQRGELELALVENIQRRDLTPLEEARAYEQLRSIAGLSQAEIAGRVGRDRSSVANALRLLKLPEEIQEMVEQGCLGASHARTLLAFDDPDERLRWAQRAADGRATVRDLERAAAEGPRSDGGGKTKKRTAPRVDPNLQAAEDRLALRLGARVSIQQRRRGGRIVIHCMDHEQLLRVFDLLMGGDDDDQEQ
ncbi:MAG: ParB/RepB/Spo0J family partition protein [Acidobacteria bacterium]|nr:ParB/RepB/Spo0J family partition protein [Acidobacteriota bacterium]